jgi:hypothetical protein
MEKSTTEKSHELAQSVIANSELLQGTTWPRWAEFTVTAQVFSEEDYEQLFAFVSGDMGGPVCPSTDPVACPACQGRGMQYEVACLECEATGEVRVCAREHYAHAQVMINGLSAFETMMKQRLEALLALLESGQVETALERLREELEGFQPLLPLE